MGQTSSRNWPELAPVLSSLSSHYLPYIPLITTPRPQPDTVATQSCTAIIRLMNRTPPILPFYSF
ncbi:hypothetical protein B0H17DRAFT_1074892 [Mycena rosella]|uniref:Uncharacterized protein n=1 Tax=Mycena rosella TaxID=1033263 RepID=A0AAD7D7H3_MYCRO|nr:hypothetical protein B0H17DRAFT_1074892 [Mycena rosella]